MMMEWLHGWECYNSWLGKEAMGENGQMQILRKRQHIASCFFRFRNFGTAHSTLPGLFCIGVPWVKIVLAHVYPAYSKFLDAAAEITSPSCC